MDPIPPCPMPETLAASAVDVLTTASALEKAAKSRRHAAASDRFKDPAAERRPGRADLKRAFWPRALPANTDRASWPS